MDPSLYLSPLTFGEFTYSLLTCEDSPRISYDKLVSVGRMYIMGWEFTVPDSALARPLEDVLSELTYDHSFKQQHKRYEGSAFELDHQFLMLKPRTTLEEKKTNCEGFSVLAAAFLRAKGEPARLLSLGRRHMMVERYLGGQWYKWEPQAPGSALVPAVYDLEYDTYYGKVLQFLNRKR